MHTMSRAPETGGDTAAIRHPRRNGILSSLENMIGLVFLWRARYWQRRSLSKLDDRLLKDVGLTRKDAAQETAKPFWRA